jgi:GT2 family glycosyltransferase
MLENICTAVLRDGNKLYDHFKSIDCDVKRYFIIDNSCGQDPSVLEAIDLIQQNKPKYIKEVIVLKSTQNTGYSGALNTAIRQNVDCDYWLFTGFDWYPEPGSYGSIAVLASDFQHGATLGTGDDEMCGILLKPSIITKVGLMDENFYPGYFEDNDYRYRQRLSGTFLEYFPLPSKHLTSSTLKSSPTFQRKNHMTFQKNLDYYVQKWGGTPGNEQYNSPFDKGYPVDYWQFNPRRIHSLWWT